VLHNVDVAEHRDPEEIRRALVEQAWRPVRWIETIEEAAHRGITHVHECGPGKVLAALTKRIVKDLEGGALADAASLHAALEALGIKG
jgi:[acyl-carrier-protein] S-malonyltransferase